ncbi:MAG: molybdopterin-dependent oxidoreductase [Permianibacter sp.]
MADIRIETERLRSNPVSTESATRTTCPYCGVGCGVVVQRSADGRLSVQGDTEHPANYGRLCSKGSALIETLGAEDRLLYPEWRDRDGNIQRVSWNIALDHIASQFARILAEHGPDAIAFYASGQMLTEDYYVANKLMKGFIGSGNIDTNSRLCMASAVAGHVRAFGADAVPASYTDLEQADLVVLSGSNLAWCHPVLFQRLKAAKAQRLTMQVIVIDPRRTETAVIADQHLAIAPGSDVWLWSGLLVHLLKYGELDLAFLERHVEGWADSFAAAKAAAPNLTTVAQHCGVAEEELLRFYRKFAATERVVTAFSQGVNQSSAGTDKVNAILNVHLATGRIGKPGCGPLSITGQPNAMGGREVGGMASTLAAHLNFSPPHRELLQRFWSAPNLVQGPGLKAVEMFEAMAEGRIKAVWIMATNPVVSLPNADRVRAALQRCELVIASDFVRHTDTVELAHVRLPALAWGEKSGTVTNSERRISRQRAFLPAPGEAKADWWAICEVGKRLGYPQAFAFQQPHEIFLEHARLSEFENTSVEKKSERLFRLGALAQINAAEYESLQPVQWPVHADGRGSERLFADGWFATANGRARMQALTPRAPHHALTAEFPLSLNTGRVRDHWHTMTRTARAAKLNAHQSEPLLQIHPDDAARYALVNQQFVRIRSRWGAALLRVQHDDGVRRGTVFAPMHWSGPYAAQARIDAVVNPACDPQSGQPEFKHTPVSVQAVAMTWQGFLITRTPLATPLRCRYWARVPANACTRYELADDSALDSRQLLQQLFGEQTPGRDCLQWGDPARAAFRAAWHDNGRLQACLFLAPTPALPDRQWLQQLFEQSVLSDADRKALLSGRPPRGTLPTGAIVCACFSVGEQTLRQHIRAGCNTPAALTRACQAGGNCGSCIPALQRLIATETASRMLIGKPLR